MSDDNLVAAVLGTIDAGDTKAFAGYLAPDIDFRFGNAPPVHGAQEVRAAVEQFLVGIRAIAHEIVGAWRAGAVIAAHGSVTYTRLDGSALSVPFAVIWYLYEERIRDYRIFVDTSAL